MAELTTPQTQAQEPASTPTPSPTPPPTPTPVKKKGNQKKKMVTAYAAKEQKRYHEKAEVDEKSMEDFREEIKGKTKREQIRKEQKKSKSRLSFEDESKGVIPGSGMA